LKEHKRGVQSPRQNWKWHTEEKAGDSQHHVKRQVCVTAVSLLLAVSPAMDVDQNPKWYYVC